MSSFPQLNVAPAIGEARDRELLKGAHSFAYYEPAEGPLAAHFYLPPGHDPAGAHRTCVLFLHGGQWDSSMPTQFVPHCHHFTTRGAVAVTVEYRVFNKHRTNPLEAMEDVRVAVAFLKQNAAELGIDPTQIIVVGAGSGGHLALSCALDSAVSKNTPAPEYRPAAVAAFSAIVDTSPKTGLGSHLFPSPAEAKLMSPLHRLPLKGLPPSLLMHARQDRVSPFAQVEKFAKNYRKKGNRCQLIDYEGTGHTFFNYNTHEQFYELSLNALDHFMVECGLLSPDEPLVI
ncbi:alpha/beta hydrolase [Roseibacillus ishigakijimensis]|uniref:Alpha/beta hydrolase n=1 Tax=Roseibacillus ishigakijimensis TaxID=454146 RepID=A0A934VKX6_9BACT|nr:alpha/beta hydrolase [Roseibacillus ishigakijimensis]MBK1832637.1 alpha/beta hydrolase [Roseibacillus ishigakijimensis]